MRLMHHKAIFIITTLLATSICFTMQKQENPKQLHQRLTAPASSLINSITKIITEANKIPKTADLCFLLHQTEEITNAATIIIQPTFVTKMYFALFGDTALLLSLGEKKFDAVQTTLKDLTNFADPKENALGYLAQQFLRIQKDEFQILPSVSAFAFLALLSAYLDKAPKDQYPENFLIDLYSIAYYIYRSEIGLQSKGEFEWYLATVCGQPEKPLIKTCHMFFKMITFFQEYTRTIIALTTAENVCFPDDMVREKLTEIRSQNWKRILETQSFLPIVATASTINDPLALRSILYCLLFARTKDDISLLKAAEKHPILKGLLEQQLYQSEIAALLD